MAGTVLKVLVFLVRFVAWFFVVTTVLAVGLAFVFCVTNSTGDSNIMSRSEGGHTVTSWALTYSGPAGASLALGEFVIVVGALLASVTRKTPHRQIGHVILILWAGLWTFNAFRVFPDGDFRLIYIMPLFLLCICIRAAVNLTRNNVTVPC